MKMVQRGNRQLQVPDELLSRYQEQGWAVIDENGKVIRPGKETDPKVIEKALRATEKELSKVKQERDELQAKLAEGQSNDTH